MGRTPTLRGSIPRRLAALSVACISLAGRPIQQLPNQRFEVVPRVAHATVGDTVTLVFRVRLDPQDLLYDTVPQPVASVPEGVRILAVEKLHRDRNRDYVGRAEIAFFRTGRQPIPTFGLPFMRGVKGMTRATLASDSAFVVIDPVAPPGNPSLKDIRELAGRGWPAPWLLAGMVGVLGLVWLVTAFPRRRTAPASPARPAPVAVPPPAAYDAAIARLAKIEAADWAGRGETGRHYAAVADTLRHYLDQGHGVRAPVLTTGELAGALPPVIAGAGRDRRCIGLLGEADLVKFARARPPAEAAAGYLRDARRLLEEWHQGEVGPDAGAADHRPTAPASPARHD